MKGFLADEVLQAVAETELARVLLPVAVVMGFRRNRVGLAGHLLNSLLEIAWLAIGLASFLVGINHAADVGSGFLLARAAAERRRVQPTGVLTAADVLVVQLLDLELSVAFGTPFDRGNAVAEPRGDFRRLAAR